MTSSKQTIEGEPGEIIKVDANGRIQIPQEQPDALLAEFDRSGMTGAAFARHYGIRDVSTTSDQERRKRDRGLISTLRH